MSIISVVVLNASLAVAIVATLAHLCRLPFQFDRTEAASGAEALDQAPERERLAA
jgi:hypothetical protein